MSVAAIVLAAGFSRRLGRPKQSLMLGGRSLLQRAVETAQASALSPILVVVREDVPLPTVRGARFVFNREAAQGMATSVRAGVHALQSSPEVGGAVVMTCDQPLLTSAHLHALCEDPERVTGSAYEARVGVPAYFPEAVFAQLLLLSGDAGARKLLQHAFSIQNEDLALDIDTEHDLKVAEYLCSLRRV